MLHILYNIVEGSERMDAAILWFGYNGDDGALYIGYLSTCDEDATCRHQTILVRHENVQSSEKMSNFKCRRAVKFRNRPPIVRFLR